MEFYKLTKRLLQTGIVAAFTAVIFLGTGLSFYNTSSTEVKSAFCGVSAIVPSVNIEKVQELESETTPTSAAEKVVSFFESKVEESEEEKALKTPFNGYEGISLTRQNIVNTAESYEGKIPYVWGSKMTLSASFNPEKSGLDCSGFVQYVYYLATGQLNETLGSTLSISNHYSEISEDELKPGDLGLLRCDGSYYTVGNMETKYYELADAKEEVSVYNQKLRDESWEDVEVSEYETVTFFYHVTYNSSGRELSRTRIDESEIGSDEIVNEGSWDPYTSTEDSDDGDDVEAVTLTTKRDETYLVTQTKRVSTLNEDDLLTEDDISLHSNHVGIYVGLDENGNKIWCHCTGKSNGNTVVIGEYPGFKYYVSVIE